MENFESESETVFTDLNREELEEEVKKSVPVEKSRRYYQYSQESSTPTKSQPNFICSHGYYRC
jgi:hypothetical protein